MKKFLLPIVLMLSGWTGVVTEVRDGNVMAILNMETGKPELVRLWACDAPEIDQPFGDKAHSFLKDLVIDQEVTVFEKQRDFRGTPLVILSLQNKSVNYVMIANGFAWLDTHLVSNGDLFDCFESACSNGMGLWADKTSVHPRVWRKVSRRAGQILDPVATAKSLESLSRMDPERLPLSPRSKSTSNINFDIS